jgi:hypothetical protein
LTSTSLSGYKRPSVSDYANHQQRNEMKKTIVLLAGLSLICSSSYLSGQVILNETFDYADDAALHAAWTTSASLSLNVTNGNPTPSALHSGTATIHQPIGVTFNITPTDANPVILTGDLWYSGNNNQRNTIGLRTGANPLFEMGFYQASDANGLAVRLVSLAGGGSAAGGWQPLVLYTELGAGSENAQWIRMQATFTTLSATVTWDLGANGSIDGSETWTGVAATGAFSDLRFGGPSGVSSGGGAFAVDNIRLEVIPEPSTLALSLLGGLGLMFFIRRRRNA